MSTPADLPAIVRNRFTSAQKSGDLTFFATRVSILQCEGLPFQLRYSPALASKPRSDKPSDKKPLDPFENPSKTLLICEIPPSHNLVLNKFPIIPNHFILATKEYKQQTFLLEESDLEASYNCMKAYRDNGEELFGFFNSGPHSGASQPHRHIQFLPVDAMRNGVDESSEWSLLTDRLIKYPRPGLPFLYLPGNIPEDATSKQLHELYTKLYRQALAMLAQDNINTIADTKLSGLESSFSYNLGFTYRTMVLCPRASEGMQVKSAESNMIGPIAINGTVLGGTLLVKNEDEWEALRGDKTILKSILQKIGFQSKSVHQDETRL